MQLPASQQSKSHTEKINAAQDVLENKVQRAGPLGVSYVDRGDRALVQLYVYNDVGVLWQWF